MKLLQKIKSFYKSLYLNLRIYIFAGLVFLLFINGHFFPIVFPIAQLSFILFLVFVLIDFILLFTRNIKVIKAQRITPERLSNGDVNEIQIYFKNQYNFAVDVVLIDEIPHQFQKRDFSMNEKFQQNEEKAFIYKLRPVRRGEYSFGGLNAFISTKIGFFSRRFIFNQGAMVPVYPSFIQMRKYELLAISNRLTDAGIKKIRKISNNNEFEKIKDYVAGDDFRTVNWKATARKSKLMVNLYQDEKAQHVYSVIDMGRTMKMPFEEMSLLDYSINASLVISNIAMRKHDKAGIITFSKSIHSIVPADRKASQMNQIMEVLYKQATNFEESDFELLYTTIRKKIKQRSLLLVYTNFEGLVSLERQIVYLKKLRKSHLVVVIFFENSEIKEKIELKADSSEEIYIKTIAEKFMYEKRQIVKELKNNGIHSIFTEPKNLTVNTINKYLELKARGLI